MIKLQGLDHVVLRTRQRARMVSFYSDVLGARLERTLESIGLYQLRAGDSLIDLLEISGAPPGDNAAADPNMDHFCLRVIDFDAEGVLAHLRACGLEPGEVAERYGAEGSGPSIYIKDPDGNTVELKGPAQPGTRLGSR